MRLLLAAAFAAFAVPAQAAPLEVYGQLPTLDEVIVSPDGTRFAYVRPNGTIGRAVVVEDIATQKRVGGVKVDGQKLRGVEWAGPDHLLIVTSQTARPASRRYSFTGRSEYHQALLLELATGKSRLLLGDQTDVGNYIQSNPVHRTIQGKPTVIVEGSIFGNHPGDGLFQIDVATGKSKLIDKSTPNTTLSTQWIVDAAGIPVARTEYNRRDGAWRLQLRRDGFWKTVQTAQAPLSPPWLVGLGDQPGAVIVARQEEGETRYRRVSLADGAWGEALEVENADDFLFDEASGRLIGVVEDSDTRRVRFLDPVDQASWDRIGRAFAGEAVTLESWSLDRKKVVVRVQGQKTGNAYVLVDQVARRADIVDDAYAGLTAEAIAPPRWVSYKAADGLEIQGVLTTPLGREAKGLPLVVLVHGGPQSQDDLRFDWWAQALASRGYAVFQPNFRGSSGYGESFVSAGYGQWGRKMQSDVSDGVRHLAAQGLIDPARVCVVGASYGGYAALAGVTLEKGVYRCAVSVAGVADLRRMLDYRRTLSGGVDDISQRYWRRFMGVERGGEESLDALSPAKLAARAEAPILLIHGRDDTVVPHDQSVVMAKALEAAGRPPEFITLDGEDHWLSRGETRQHMLNATVGFLERHNPPR